MNIIEYTNNSHTTSAPNRKIEYIVVHYTAGVSSQSGSAKNTIDSIYINGNTNVSADYTVDQSGAYLYNGDIKNRYTWHCGCSGNPDTKYGGATVYGICKNSNSIGIEVCSDGDGRYVKYANTKYWSYNQKCLEILTELVKYLMQTYNIDINHVVRHFDVTGKLCPGIIGWNTGPLYNENGITNQLNTDEKWKAFKNNLSGSANGVVSSTANCGYYYHPLGDLAKAFTDGTADDNEWAHTYDDKEYQISSLDWGSGNAIPQESSIYSMTNGIIYNIIADHSEKNQGFAIYVKTDRLDGTGKPICIHYLKLSGVSDKIANIIGCSSGSMSLEEYKSISINYSESITIEMGEQIGYTNSWYGNSANFCTNFLYEKNNTDNDDTDNNGNTDNENTDNENTDNDDINSYINISPHINDKEQLNNKFSLEAIDNSIAKYTVKCNENLVGRENGMVRLQNGGSSQYYPVYPFISYLVCQQTPTYISNSTSTGPGGGISMLDKSQISCVENMDSQAVDFYLTGSMGESWIGQYPNSIQEVNSNQSGLRYAVAICKRELNFEIFSGVAYAKLLRAKMIGETWQSGNNMKEWFEGLHPSQFDGKSTWLAMTFSEDDLQYAQLVYMNLRYPEIYGSESFSGSQEFHDAIVFGCQQIPIYNLSPVNYHPLAFVVNFNVNTNKDEGEHGGAGNFLMYRQRSRDMSGFNSKVRR